MITESMPSFNADLAEGLVGALQLFGSEPIQEKQTSVEAFLREQIGGDASTQSKGATGLSTAWAAAWNNSLSVVVCHGTDLNSQPLAQVQGYVEFDPLLALQNLDRVKSTWAANAGKAAADFLNAYPRYLGTTTKIFAGHSAGHSISVETALNLPQIIFFSPAFRIRFVSFGGNAVASSSVYSFLSQLDHTRWMNDNDPVPLAPWVCLRFLPTVGVLTSIQIRRINAFVHLPGGTNLSSDGTKTPALLPSLAEVTPRQSFIQWMNGVYNGEISGHSTLEYLRRIKLGATEEAPPRVRGAPSEQDPAQAPPLNVPPVESVGDAENLAARAATELQAISRQVTNDAGTILPDQRYRARKINGKWWVTLAGNPFCISNGKRDARKIARIQNKALDATPRIIFTA